MVLARWLGVLSLVCWATTGWAALVVEQAAPPQGNRASVTQPLGVRVDIASTVSDQTADKHFALLNRMMEVLHGTLSPLFPMPWPFYIVDPTRRFDFSPQSRPSIRAEVRDAKTVESLRNNGM